MKPGFAHVLALSVIIAPGALIAEPLSMARLSQILATKGAPVARLETLHARDREILVALGAGLRRKYGELLDGAEIVFTRIEDFDTIVYRMDFLNLKSAVRAEGICQVLELDECFMTDALGNARLTGVVLDQDGLMVFDGMNYDAFAPDGIGAIARPPEARPSGEVTVDQLPSNGVVAFVPDKVASGRDAVDPSPAGCPSPAIPGPGATAGHVLPLPRPDNSARTAYWSAPARPEDRGSSTDVVESTTPDLSSAADRGAASPALAVGGVDPEQALPDPPQIPKAGLVPEGLPMPQSVIDTALGLFELANGARNGADAQPDAPIETSDMVRDPELAAVPLLQGDPADIQVFDDDPALDAASAQEIVSQAPGDVTPIIEGWMPSGIPLETPGVGREPAGAPVGSDAGSDAGPDTGSEEAPRQPDATGPGGFEKGTSLVFEILSAGHTKFIRGDGPVPGQ